MRYCWLLLLMPCFACSAEPAAQHYVVALPVTRALEHDFYIQLVSKVLEVSKAPNEIIDLDFSNQNFSQARWIAEVRKGDRNLVFWTVTSNEREQVLRPVRIPLLKGLLGYRVLVIRKEDRAAFAAIRTEAELRQFRAGQGTHWPDTGILRAAGLPVVEGMSSENLYKMLAAKRFDYFPRGITETAQEAENIRTHNLMIEPHLLVIYPTAMYFFVNNNNTELAQRLEKGMEVLIASGEFDKLLYDLPEVKMALEDLKQNKRKVIRLGNPFLPVQTPLNEPRYWLTTFKP